MPSQNLSTLFSTTGGAAGTNSGGYWNRPLHETQCQMAILPGGSCCLLVPATATRVVVEMWGQGGGGANSCCCQWGGTGGQAGNYAYKVWSTAASNSPAIRGACMSFCGCVCTCDCQSYDATGSAGQFTRMYDCNASYWYGCVTGGAGGLAYCTATCWWSGGNGAGNCCDRYDTCKLFSASSTTVGCYGLPASESNGNNVGPSCLCGGAYICLGATGINYPIGFTTAGGAAAPVTTVSSGPTTAAFDCIFPPVACGTFDVYKTGACGFTNTSGWAGGSNAGSCDSKVGVGGAAYAGGAQQQRSGNPTNFYYCGLNGNFPGGGARSGGAFGGGCCFGGQGGGGLILISYKI